MAVAAAAAACVDPTQPNFGGPLRTAVEDTGQLFAITGVPTYLPGGINLSSRNVTVVTVFDDGTVPFDVAFDITPSGQVAVMPPRTVALGPNVVPLSLQLLKATAPWNQVTEAPLTGFQTDTIQYVAPGQTVVMLVRPPTCQLQLQQTIYAKFVVDSLNVTTRKIFYRLLANPNCGRRGLVAGQS